MTGLQRIRRRSAIAAGMLRPETLAFGAVMAAGLGAALLSIRAPAQEVAAAGPQVTIALAKAQALVAATSGPASVQVQAIGEQAKLINASLPFSSSPVEAARPFLLSGGAATDYERALLCLTQAVYYEAGFEPVEGRRAVAQVVLNRMRHPAFPKSVCGVVYQGSSSPVCQFTFVCDGSLYRAPAAGAWRQARTIAQAALAGHVERSVGEATHYHADYVAPRWAPMLTKITKLGAHIFYRWPGAWGTRAAFNGRYIGEPRDPHSMRPALRAEQALEVLAPVEPVTTGPIVDGTIIQRAPNDVGGLLDTSKGWTLTIPAPNETGGAAARALAAQEKKAPPAAESRLGTPPPSSAPLIASR
jgi:spore germination cell wall hydrolase CwlJ-like protein